MTYESDLAKTEQDVVPLETFEDETTKLNDSSAPPVYEYPKIDFQQGWKDRGFTIIFWIYAVSVITISLVFGIPALQSCIKHLKNGELTMSDVNMTWLLYIFTGVLATAVLISFVTFLFLQLCAAKMIVFSLVFVILMLISLITCLSVLYIWQLAIVPLVVLVLVIVFLIKIRKRFRFAEIHIQIACAVLRQHPSLVLASIFMLILQILWFICWLFMLLGTLHALDRPLFDNFMYRLVSNRNSQTTKLDLNRYDQINRRDSYQQEESNRTYPQILVYVIIFSMLLLWYWAAITFANIVHFISACSVGHWWFANDVNKQYRMGNSIKRAFTTNFGTICFGSFFEAIIKALRSCIKKEQRNFLSMCANCILSSLEKLIGYINEWAFVYSALTGQSFVKAGKSFFSLLTQRGWTVVVNDSIVGNCLAFVNFLVGLTTATVAALMFYLLFSTVSAKLTAAIITVSFIGFCLGTVLNATLTTILKSCVRAAFVCFALNPAALGATHPDYLQRLTNVWHELYPNEFATSGYTDQFLTKCTTSKLHLDQNRAHLLNTSP